jgi:hypothetical protein
LYDSTATPYDRYSDQLSEAETLKCQAVIDKKKEVRAALVKDFETVRNSQAIRELPPIDETLKIEVGNPIVILRYMNTFSASWVC